MPGDEVIFSRLLICFTVVVEAVSYMVEVQSLSSETADARLCICLCVWVCLHACVCAFCSTFSQQLLLYNFRISSRVKCVQLGSLLETMSLVCLSSTSKAGCTTCMLPYSAGVFDDFHVCFFIKLPRSISAKHHSQSRTHRKWSFSRSNFSAQIWYFECTKELTVASLMFTAVIERCLFRCSTSCKHQGQPSDKCTACHVWSADSGTLLKLKPCARQYVAHVVYHTQVH